MDPENRDNGGTVMGHQTLKQLAESLLRKKSGTAVGTARDTNCPTAQEMGMPRGAPISRSESPENWSQLSLSDLERQRVALKIESQFGDLWLVSTEDERNLADDNPVYTVAEASSLSD